MFTQTYLQGCYVGWTTDYFKKEWTIKHYVRIEKLKQVSETETLPTGYWIKGRLINDEIRVNVPVLVERYIRNGESILGVMNTSVVEDIVLKGNGILQVYTQNSVYEVQFISEEDALDGEGESYGDENEV